MDNNTIAILGIVTLVVIVLSIAYVNIEARKREKERREAIMAYWDIWGADICTMLVRRQIAIDMTQRQVMLAWGEPNYSDQEEITKKGRKIRWVYGVPRKGARYVWFTDAIVTKIKA